MLTLPMLTIRLSRVGRKHHPSYRILVQEKGRDPYGSFLENIGLYDPKPKDFIFKLDRERYDHWVKQGAQPSDRIAKLVARADSAAK